MQRSASPWLDLEREFVQTVGFVYGVPNFLATDKEPNEGPRERFSCFGAAEERWLDKHGRSTCRSPTLRTL